MTHPKKLTVLYVVIFLIVVLNAFLIWQTYDFIYKSAGKDVEVNHKLSDLLLVQGNDSVIKMFIPAVDTNNTGILTVLEVEAREGTGRVLVDIDGLLFWADTQQSIRVARRVASDVTLKNLSQVDLTYNVKAEASVIGGNSAGAALTLATIGALLGKQLNKNIMITGTINHDGKLGPVSSILQKAQAAKKAGVKIFLVPLTQSKEVSYETKKHCDKYGKTTLCNDEASPVSIDIAKEAGIEVKEVSTIYEAVEYFFGK